MGGIFKRKHSHPLLRQDQYADHDAWRNPAAGHVLAYANDRIVNQIAANLLPVLAN